jgi:hypothetical protein
VSVVGRTKGRRRLILVVALMTAAATDQVSAQSLNPGPPGPFVFDIRGAMSALPTSELFVPQSDIVADVPSRGFGGTVGGHVYAIGIGPGRLGIGVDFMLVRGTTADVATTLSSVDPQLSFNFGTSDGWSYLSAGVGGARVKVDSVDLSESVRSFNWGGGARWFVGPHVGVGFDVRVRHLAAGDVVPKATVIGAAVGLSLK